MEKYPPVGSTGRLKYSDWPPGRTLDSITWMPVVLEFVGSGKPHAEVLWGESQQDYERAKRGISTAVEDYKSDNREQSWLAIEFLRSHIILHRHLALSGDTDA